MSDKESKAIPPSVETGRLIYGQPNDCCDDGTLGHQIEIETHDGGGGKYLTIKTERWSFDSAEQLVELLEEAKRRLL
jgi:hypothetical protein